jgi:peptide/nickel transport system substrate-binding protein
VLSITLLAACAAPRAAEPPATGSADARPLNAAPQRVVTFVLRTEPPNLNDRLDRMGLGYPLITSSLAYLDASLAPQPLLAESLPSQDDGSWTVGADGTMKTVFRLRPDLKWHDGNPITAGDFSFAHQVYTDRDIPVTTRVPETLMSAVTALDDRTLEIQWKETYVEANALVGSQLAPLPRHLLQELYTQDKPSFATSTFWASGDFVGSGPYRVKDWDHGVRIALTASPYFPLGKPRIDNIDVRFVTDSNTIVAGFFAGSIDFAEYTAIAVEQAVILQQRWDQDRGGRVYSETLFGTRYLEFQHRDVPDHQKALTDPRVRRGLVHALDRQALTDALQAGYGGVADTGYPASAPLYSRVAEVISRYPHDLRAADRTFTEAGWTRGADGLYRDASGAPLSVEVRVTGEREQEGQIIASDWRQAGIDARSYVVPRALTTDVENRVNFPGVAVSAQPEMIAAMNVTTDLAPSPQNRFTGKNRGSYSNPEIDRLYAQSLLTLDTAQRENVLVELERVFTQDVAQGLLYYQPRIAAGVSSVQGVKPPVMGTLYWNSWEWSLAAS